MDLLSFYETLIQAAWMKTDEGGRILVDSSAMTGVEDKGGSIEVSGKPLVMPTDEVLRMPNQSEMAIFHPLSENQLRGESAIVKTLRHNLSARINYTLLIVIRDLLQIGAKAQAQSKLTPRQAEVLPIIKNSDEKMVENFINSVHSAIKKNGIGEVFYKIYLKRGGKVKGKTEGAPDTVYARLGVASFPFFDALDSGDSKVFGVQYRKKDIETIKNLLLWLIPNLDVDGYYNAGSDSSVAPFLDALYRTFGTIASVINEKLELFKKTLPDAKKLMISEDWIEPLENCELLLPQVRTVPNQPESTGNDRVENKMAQAQAMNINTPTAPVMTQVANVAPQQPMQQEAPVQQKKPGSVSMADICKAQQQHQQQMQQSAMQNMPMMPYQQPVMYPQQAQMMQQPQMAMQQMPMQVPMQPYQPQPVMMQPYQQMQPMMPQGYQQQPGTVSMQQLMMQANQRGVPLQDPHVPGWPPTNFAATQQQAQMMQQQRAVRPQYNQVQMGYPQQMQPMMPVNYPYPSRNV